MPSARFWNGFRRSEISAKPRFEVCLGEDHEYDLVTGNIVLTMGFCSLELARGASGKVWGVVLVLGAVCLGPLVDEVLAVEVVMDVNSSNVERSSRGIKSWFEDDSVFDGGSNSFEPLGEDEEVLEVPL